jgi:hypothetical protein
MWFVQRGSGRERDERTKCERGQKDEEVSSHGIKTRMKVRVKKRVQRSVNSLANAVWCAPARGPAMQAFAGAKLMATFMA